MGKELGRGLRRLMARHLDDIEVLLSDEMALHSQPELVATGGGEDQRGNIDAEIGDLQAVPNHDIRKCRAADELFGVEVDQVDIEVVGAFSVREAEIQSHLLMLKRKGDRLKMGENADQAFLFCQAVFDDLVTDQEGLDTGFCDICHRSYSTKTTVNLKRVTAFLRTERTAGSHGRRKTPRFQMQVRIFLTAGEVEGEGVVLDLSKGGCRVKGEADLLVGSEVDAQIYFPGY